MPLLGTGEAIMQTSFSKHLATQISQSLQAQQGLVDLSNPKVKEMEDPIAIFSRELQNFIGNVALFPD